MRKLRIKINDSKCHFDKCFALIKKCFFKIISKIEIILSNLPLILSGFSWVSEFVPQWNWKKKIEIFFILKIRNIFLEKMFETWNIPCLDSISKNIFEICFECLSSTQKNEFRWVVFISIFQCKQIIDDSANLKVNKVKTNEQNFHFHWLLLLKKFAYFLCTLKFMKIEIIRIC